MDEDPLLADAAPLRLLIATAPLDQAEPLAQGLVEDGLCACASLVPGVRSLYRWQGALQNEPETVLLLKAPAAGVPALAAALRERHPYEVPELLVIGPEQALAPYLAWALGADRTDDPGA